MTAPAITLEVAGISRTRADERYVHRFVGNVLAADTYLGDNSAGAGQEVVLSNPSGPVMGGFPKNTHGSLFSPTDGLRAAIRVRIIRTGGVAALMVGHAIGGTFDAPTGALASAGMGGVAGNARTSTGTDVTPALFQCNLRENATAAAFGSQWDMSVVDVGGATLKAILSARGGGANIAEYLLRQATGRFIPTTTGSLRNPANTQDVLAWDATGVGFNGVPTVARPLLPLACTTVDIANALNTLGLTRLV
jgi:hypothetical protein